MKKFAALATSLSLLVLPAAAFAQSSASPNNTSGPNIDPTVQHLLDFRAVVCRDGRGRHRGRCGRGKAATKRGCRKNDIHLHHSFASSNRSPLPSLTCTDEFSGGTSFETTFNFIAE
jgi:hypothetical protein